MDSTKLIKGVEKTELYRLLDKLYQEKSTISLWQSTDTEKILIDVEIQKLNTTKYVMVLQEKNKEHQKLASIDLARPIYCRTKLRSLAFKCLEFKLKNNALTVSLPSHEEMVLEELRSSPRFNMEQALDREISIEVEVGLSGSGKFKSHRYNIIDISETGIGVEVKAHQMGKLKVGELAIIKTVCKIDLNKLETKVIHITKYDEEKKLFKAGLQFKDAIDKKTLEQILN